MARSEWSWPRQNPKPDIALSAVVPLVGTVPYIAQVAHGITDEITQDAIISVP
jgi:hypothetical protein